MYRRQASKGGGGHSKLLLFFRVPINPQVFGRSAAMNSSTEESATPGHGDGSPEYPPFKVPGTRFTLALFAAILVLVGFNWRPQPPGLGADVVRPQASGDLSLGSCPVELVKRCPGMAAARGLPRGCGTAALSERSAGASCPVAQTAPPSVAAGPP